LTDQQRGERAVAVHVGVAESDVPRFSRVICAEFGPAGRAG
jgi:hypothetical protein